MDTAGPVGRYWCSRTNPAVPEAAVQNTDLCHAYSYAMYHDGQQLLAPECSLPGGQQECSYDGNARKDW
jgi:hypothetical protein